MIGCSFASRGDFIFASMDRTYTSPVHVPFSSELTQDITKLPPHAKCTSIARTKRALGRPCAVSTFRSGSERTIWCLKCPHHASADFIKAGFYSVLLPVLAWSPYQSSIRRDKPGPIGMVTTRLPPLATWELLGILTFGTRDPHGC